MDEPRTEEPKRGSEAQHVYGFLADVLFLPAMLLGAAFQDSRAMVAVATVAVLASFGCRVMSLRATPGLSRRAKRRGAAIWGVMVALYLGGLAWVVNR